MEPVIPRWHLGAVRRAVSKSASDLVSLRVPSYAEHVVGDDESGYSLGGYDCDLLSFIEWSRGIRVVADLDDALAQTEGMFGIAGDLASDPAPHRTVVAYILLRLMVVPADTDEERSWLCAMHWCLELSLSDDKLDRAIGAGIGVETLRTALCYIQVRLGPDPGVADPNLGILRRLKWDACDPTPSVMASIRMPGRNHGIPHQYSFRQDGWRRHEWFSSDVRLALAECQSALRNVPVPSAYRHGDLGPAQLAGEVEYERLIELVAKLPERPYTDPDLAELAMACIGLHLLTADAMPSLGTYDLLRPIVQANVEAIATSELLTPHFATALAYMQLAVSASAPIAEANWRTLTLLWSLYGLDPTV